MRILLTIAFILHVSVSFSQKKLPPLKYPSLLWEITGNGLKRPSYLFGTMHVSNKMVFNLSDSFYLGIRNADVVALETNPADWQEDFSRYDLSDEGGGLGSNSWAGAMSTADHLSLGTLRLPAYEKLIEGALYSNPSLMNNFLYRNQSSRSGDFEEDTYLDLHIFQVGKKWGKRLCGVENFDQSMQLMKEAYIDDARDRTDRKNTDVDEEFSYRRMEDAYRTGNLDLLDTINKLNGSAVFDEKFLYRRNEIQAQALDSILRTRASLFAGVGAAHLPGQRGVIELLRRQGYHLRPVRMTVRTSRYKDAVERIRVPVPFSRQTSADGFFSVRLPGKLYAFSESDGAAGQLQCADMVNGSYYMVTRIRTHAALMGHSTEVVRRKLDSVLYENIPGKILSKQSITRNGYAGYDIINRTRRGDHQRYQLFITPFEIIIFKMSGNGAYVTTAQEADQFFSSIQLKPYSGEWKKHSFFSGGFETEFPHEPQQYSGGMRAFTAFDPATATAYAVLRADIHQHDFLEEDSFELNLMEESFGSGEFIEKQISRKQGTFRGHASLDARYRYKDGSVAFVRFLIRGPHYYTLIAAGKKETARMTRFLDAFSFLPFGYPGAWRQTDTTLFYTVNSPVLLEKTAKKEMFPSEAYRFGKATDDDEEREAAWDRSRIIVHRETGEQILVRMEQLSPYEPIGPASKEPFSQLDPDEWTVSEKKSEQEGPFRVWEYVLGNKKSSRTVRTKFYKKGGTTYTLKTTGDTSGKESAFITSFFKTFRPLEPLESTDPASPKAEIFFRDFFSPDSQLHKRAVQHIVEPDLEDEDLPQLKKAIRSLGWKEKKYLEVKKDLIRKAAFLESAAASGYLRELYAAAGDTVELQYTVLETLLQQKTKHAYTVFRDIMTTDPPVLDEDVRSISKPEDREDFSGELNDMRSVYLEDFGRTIVSPNRKGSFLDELTDSLELTASIIKDLLPLIQVHDYEQPLMQLMGIMVDSNLLHAKDYQQFLPKFLIEARQQLKKQVISEKNRSIEKAQEEKQERSYERYDKNDDDGNSLLSLYATLLLPFWDQNAAIPSLMDQLLASNDQRLKYNTLLLLLRRQKKVPDTLLSFFAARDDYRYELYSDLERMGRSAVFPPGFRDPVALLKSKLIFKKTYTQPDSIAFLDKLPCRIGDRSGYIYFFRYKQKKDDYSWKLAYIGLIPESGIVATEQKSPGRDEWMYQVSDFTGEKILPGELLQDQLQKLVKKIVYSRRRSSMQFYADEGESHLNLLRTLLKQ